jgi:ATP-dependent helicase/nuclease subunit A
LFPHTLIRASAGTGKTFQLSNRYLGLVVAGVTPDEILATTFTRKAAGEILQRILFRLAEAANDPEHATILGRFIDAKLNCERAQHVLETLVHQLHRLHVSTLDSFFAQLAGSFDLELGLPQGWRIVEPSADARLRNEAIQAVLAAEESRDVLALMHLLTKGEATRTIGEQLRTLVTGLYGLYLETTPKAWDSLPRPSRLTDAKLAAALESLETFPLRDGSQLAQTRDEDLARARVEDWPEFIAKGIACKINEGKETFNRQKIEPGLMEVYQAVLRHAKAVLVGQLADQTKATRQFLEKFHVHYRRLKLARRALRFDDVTRALADSPLSQQSRQVRFRLDTQINHVLLDEFQDTSLMQWNVLRPLVNEVVTGEMLGQEQHDAPSPRPSPPVGNGLRGVPPLAKGPSTSDSRNATDCVPYRGRIHRTFFCVGDVKQAIYGWRGGVAELFDALPAAWPELKQPTLTHSRRSAQPVIDTVNRVFADLSSNPVLQKFVDAAGAWRRGFETHTTAMTNLSGYAQMVTAPLADDDQESVTLLFAAAEVKRLVGEAPGKSVGVLARDNDAVASLIRNLRDLGVSASEEGGNPLTDSQAVLVVLSLLTLADHPGDTAARFHVAASALGAALGYTDYADDRAAHRLSLRARQQLLTHGYGPTIYRWARDLAGCCDARDASRLMQLVEIAYRFEGDAGLRTRDFVNFVEQKRVEAPSPAAVRVMTVHQAKGLQFDIVALPQLDVKLTGQPPPVVVGRPEPTAAANLVCRYANESLRNMLPDEVRAAFEHNVRQEIRESLCVIYVALTRAIHALHLIVAPSKEKDKQLPASMSGVLRAALTDGGRLPANSIVYEHGERQWCRHGVQATPDTPGDVEPAESQEPAFQVALAPAEKRRRILERDSPSDLAHRTHVDLATRMALATGRAVNRGSAFHAWFEQIEWLDDGEPDETLLRTVGLRTGAVESELDEWLPQFRSKLRNPKLRAVLTKRSYISGESTPWSKRSAISAALAGNRPTIEVYRERPFAVRLRDKLLSGTFDRLLLVRGGTLSQIVAAEVLDYKTDAVAAGDPQAVANIVDRYRPQLAAYREAVSVMFGLPSDFIITRLAVIEADAVVDVDES